MRTAAAHMSGVRHPRSRAVMGDGTCACASTVVAAKWVSSGSSNGHGPLVDHGVPDAVAAKLPPVERYGLRVVLFALAVSLVGIPFGLLLHQVTTDGPLTSFDEGAAEDIHAAFAGNDAVINAFKVVSDLGKPIVLALVVGAAGVWLLRRGARKLVVFLAVTCIGGGIVDTIVKVGVGRPRPQVDDPVIEAFGQSFPSGHSMSSLVCYGALYLVFAPLLTTAHRRLALGVAIGLPLLIGFSRLTLAVHYVSDVLGGYVLGAAWLVASVAAFEVWREDRGRRRTDPIAEGVEPEEDRLLADHQV
jgi:undecaprenyl-diphosphatase